MSLGSDPAGEVGTYDEQPQLQEVMTPPLSEKFGGYYEQPTVYREPVAAPAKVPWWQPTWEAVTRPIGRTWEAMTSEESVERGATMLWEGLLNKYVFRIKTEERTGNKHPEPTPAPAPTTPVNQVTERSFWERVLQPVKETVAEQPAAAAVGGSALVIALIVGGLILLSRSK